MFGLARLTFGFLKSLGNTLKQEEFVGFLAMISIFISIGSVFYTNVEHWRALDSVYFCVMTLVTVGYGDFTPHTDAGKIFTIFYVVVGVGLFFGLIGITAHHTLQDIRFKRNSQ